MTSAVDEIIACSGIVGVLFVIAGIFMRFIAPHIKPNVFIGARFSYSIRSRDNWVATNRFAGTVFLFAGLLIVPLSWGLEWIGIVNYFPFFLFIIILTSVVSSFWFSRQYYLKKEQPREK